MSRLSLLLAAQWFLSCVASPMTEDIIKQFFKPGGVEQTDDGFYIEMGALDGVRQSNSEQLDNRLGWHGLLLEANEEMCKQLFTNRPRALKICTGCCAEESPGWFQFESTNDPFVSAAVHAMDKDYKEHYHTFRDGKKVVTRKHQVPCQALGRILRGHGVTKVDFFSLDVEGAELEVLNSFDWSIPVRVFVIEVSEKNLESVPTLLKKHGYVLSDYDVPRVFDIHGGDQMWVHPDWKAGWDRGAVWKQWPMPKGALEPMAGHWLSASMRNKIEIRLDILIALGFAIAGALGYQKYKKK